ncbi:MAG: efflux RND transporter periplasmic adaptor subunit [Proteobacteria bacterium]|nr:efflux RND transporter periplasmic adaptor subunit [Pseudomonadota bacterium]
MPRKSVSVLALLLVAGGLYVAFGRGDGGGAARYKLQPVDRGELTQSVSANGTLNPVTLVNVGTQVSGTVTRLHVDYNAEVKKGQVLAELDDVLFAAQVAQDQASLKSAQASLDLAAATEQRDQSLFAQEYISRQELDQAVQAHQAAQAQVNQSRAALKRSRANLGYSVIRSPVSGVVVDRQIDVGQTVAASFQTPTLFKIAQDLAKMQIDSSFAEADIGQIRTGQKVRFNVDAFPSRSFHGSVRLIRLNPTTTQNVVTYDVVIDVANPELILLPGMTAYVNIGVARREDALRVPNAALRFKPVDQPVAAGSGPKPGEGKKKRDGSSGTVWVLRDGKPVAVAIGLGITDGRNTEVTGGELKAGDAVIVAENGKGKPAENPSGPRFRPF